MTDQVVVQTDQTNRSNQCNTASHEQNSLIIGDYEPMIKQGKMIYGDYTSTTPKKAKTAKSTGGE